MSFDNNCLTVIVVFPSYLDSFLFQAFALENKRVQSVFFSFLSNATGNATNFRKLEKYLQYYFCL